MKVCLVTNFYPPITVGGAEAMCHQTAIGLRRAGHDVSVIVGHPHITNGAATPASYEIDGVTVYRIFPDRTLNPFLRSYKQLYNNRAGQMIESVLKQIMPDVVHFHNISGLTLSPIRKTAGLNVPAVITMHDYWSLCPNNMLFTKDNVPCKHFAGRALCFNCFRKYDFWGNLPYRQKIIKAELSHSIKRIISPSHFLSDRMAEAGYDPANLRVIYHGIDIAAFRNQIKPWREVVDTISRNDPESIRKMETIQAADFLIQFSGHLTVHKGGEYLIGALSTLHDSGKNFVLLISGLPHPTELSRLKAMIASNGLEKNIVFMGKVDQHLLPSLYARADVTVVPSIWYENASVVIAEAMMAGTPVIASRIGGNPEFVIDGENGFIFEPGNAEELRNKIVMLANDPALKEKMRRRARQRSEELFNLDAHVGKIEACYREAINPMAV